jgi:hypothetical protein
VKVVAGLFVYLREKPMGQSVQFWNSLIATLTEENIFIERRDDWFNIINLRSGGTGLVLRLMNTRPHADEFEDLDDFNGHPIIEFYRIIERCVELAKPTTIYVGKIYIMNREFEVFLY